MKTKLKLTLKLIAVLLACSCFAGCLAFPVAIQVQGQHGTYGYSAKRGVEITIDATK